MAGFQVRGKNAVFQPMKDMLFVGLVMAVQALVALAVGRERLDLEPRFGDTLRSGVVKRRVRNWCLMLEALVDAWTHEALTAGTALSLVAWGRGRYPDEVAQALQECVASNAEIRQAQQKLASEADRVLSLRDNGAEQRLDAASMVMAAMAQRMAEKAPERSVSETILQADELALEEGDRTQRQHRLTEIYAQFAGIRCQETRAVDSA